MTDIAGIPYIEAQFDKHQDPLDPNIETTINAWVTAQDISDLIVMSHGWNNDISEARSLYGELVGNIALRLAQGSGSGMPGRTLGVLGLLWPSKRFASEDLIPGGAASAGADLDDAMLASAIDNFRDFFDVGSANDTLDAMRHLVPDLDRNPQIRERYFELARTLMGDPQDLDADDLNEIPAEFFSAASSDDIADIFDELKKPDLPQVSTLPTSSGAAGLSLSGFKAGAMRLLNYLTYYQMKKRARKTGVSAVAPLLSAVNGQNGGLRIHLVGHSFGGLLVTSVAWGGEGDKPVIPIDTMTLLQAAFSHNGFAKEFREGKKGRYRKVLLEPKRVVGPILVTHTNNDKAVGVAYALASRLARQDAAGGVGSPSDRFGGIGANGAQHTPEAIEGHLENPGNPYDFQSGKLYNLLADEHIDDHSDVRGEAVAHAIVECISHVN